MMHEYTYEICNELAKKPGGFSIIYDGHLWVKMVDRDHLCGTYMNISNGEYYHVSHLFPCQY